MKAIRIPEGTWRPDAARLYHFGTYRVPQDMPEDLARRAVAEGVAEEVLEEQPGQETVPDKRRRRPSA